MAETVIIDDSDLREKVITAFTRVLGAPLPTFAKRGEVERLGLRSVASLSKDACERAGRPGELLPDAILGGQTAYLVDNLINYAVNATACTKGKKPPKCKKPGKQRKMVPANA